MKKSHPSPTEIDVAPLTNTNSVILTYLDRQKVFTDPPYQRPANIWSLEKKQLLIDSIMNRFDVPKLYFHEYPEPKLIGGKKRKYAVIDGKQRLLAIWAFIDNEFTLPDKFDYLPDPSLNLSGLTYRELSETYPHVKALFDNYLLAIMVVRTDDIELIEDMFSRLNEAVPLNAAEKRNAFGGPLPPLIRKSVLEPFFSRKLPFENTRYRHFDIACKFLYLCYSKAPTDTKKVKLDEFVKEFYRTQDKAGAKALFTQASSVTNNMNKVFTNGDHLLKNIGTLVSLFLVFREAARFKEIPKLKRSRLVAFEAEREKNAALAAKNIAKADYELLKFDELTSTVNDEYAIRFRCRVISAFVAPGSKTAKVFKEKD
jgi:hypothetical protein